MPSLNWQQANQVEKKLRETHALRVKTRKFVLTLSACVACSSFSIWTCLLPIQTGHGTRRNLRRASAYTGHTPAYNTGYCMLQATLSFIFTQRSRSQLCYVVPPMYAL